MHTPSGYYSPIMGRLYENYHSESWDADMPFAIFFNGGVAIHATHLLNYHLLGQRASGGCARLELENTKNLFELVKNEIEIGTTVQISNTGCLKRNVSGKLETQTGYRTLIAVIDSSIRE